MFINYKKTILLCSILLFSTTNYAEMYKWVDENGQTHYSQQAPKDKEAQIIKAPPPPAVSHEQAQKEIDILIEKQNGTFEENEKERQRLAEEEATLEQQKEFCRVAQHNLKQYQDNPGRRMQDPDGNVTRPTEEQRQTIIADLQKQIQEHCQ